MKVAIVHDQLFEFGGAERVLVDLKKIYPDAEVYLSGYNEDVARDRIKDFNSWNVHVSWVSKIPFYSRLYSPLRFLMPKIWESFDMSEYDLVISSSGWFMSKGVKTKAPTVHLSYIHHPPASLYGYQTAIEWQKYWPIKVYGTIVNHFNRLWDYKASQRPDVLIANSEETRNRIQKFYRRDAEVIYPAVSIPKAEPTYTRPKDTYYITVSRLAFKKHVRLLVEAANQYGFNLKVIGSGREEEMLRELAGPTVEVLGHVPDEDFDRIFSGATAFLNAAVEEEFGISAVEGLGRGLPVIAYASGGLLETVQDGKNGFHFKEHTPEALYKAIRRLESLPDGKYIAMRKAARKSSKLYTFDIFKKKLTALVRKTLKEAKN